MTLLPDEHRATSSRPAVTNEFFIHVLGEFELVAIALTSMRSTVTVVENFETHLLFTFPEGGAGIARPLDDDTVEVVVLDQQGQQIAERMAAALAALLDYPVTLERRAEATPTDRYAASYEKATATLVIEGVIDETDTEQLREDLHVLTDLYSASLTIDLSEVTFLPSRAIGAIVGAQQAASARGTEIRLRTTPGSISEKILTIIGLPYETT